MGGEVGDWTMNDHFVPVVVEYSRLDKTKRVLRSRGCGEISHWVMGLGNENKELVPRKINTNRTTGANNFKQMNFYISASDRWYTLFPR